MKLGIDISQIVYKGTGVARFTEGLLHSILTYDKQNEWTFFASTLRQQLSTEIEQSILRHGHKLIEWTLPPKALSFIWNDIHSPHFTLDVSHFNGLDWFITSDWTEPPLKTKKATIVHDLVFRRYPETVHGSILKTQQKRLKWVAKESDLIFADSKSTAEDLHTYFKIDNAKIVVNYPGVDTSTMDPSVDIKKKYNLPSEFILTVGKREPRKNLKRLVDSYLAMNIEPKPDLIIVGMQGWETTEYIDDHIHYPGFVSDEDLAALYQEALFFVMPSIYEGFGYPVVEAMSYGCPVAVSNTSSLKEIAEGSAVLFDPHDEKEITEALYNLITDSSLRKDLIKKGQKRSEDFTWKRYYETFIKSLSNKV